LYEIDTLPLHTLQGQVCDSEGICMKLIRYHYTLDPAYINVLKVYFVMGAF